MYRWSTLFIVVAASTAAAADATKPNTLTSKEIADGWILLFDGETKFGWKTEGLAEVKEGALVLGGDKSTLAQFTSAFPAFTVLLEYEAKREGTPSDTAQFW